MNNGIILSSSVCFARNIKDYKFVSKLTLAEADKIIDDVTTLLLSNGMKTIRMRDVDELYKGYLLDMGLATKLLINNQNMSAISVGEKEDVVVMVNEAEHLCICGMELGVNLYDAYKKAKPVLEMVENSLSLAYDDEYGFLCSCPTNVGSALTARVTACLPALVKTNQLNKLSTDLNQLGIAIRAHEDYQHNYLFDVYNSASLGIDDMGIINKVQSAVMRLQELEMNARRLLCSQNQDLIRDLACRSLGLLTHCYMLTYNELTEWIANIKLGSSLGLISSDNDKLDEILRHATINEMSYWQKKTFTQESYSIALARYVQDIWFERRK